MSDLQCPAIIVLLTAETIVDCDLRGRRVSTVFLAEGSRALAEATRLAAASGCQVDRADLGDAAKLARQLEQIADEYRGETVAIVADGRVLCAVLEWQELPAEPVALAIDNAGLRLVRNH